MSMQPEQTPQELNMLLAGESADFIVHSKHTVPFSKSLYSLFFGIFWTGFISMFLYSLVGPILAGKDVHFTSNHVPVTANMSNLSPLIFPGIMVSVFMIIGLWIIGNSIFQLTASGAWYVATPKRLIEYKKNKNRSISWSQFTGEIATSGNAQKGSITLTLATGQMVSTKHGSQYVPDMIYLIGVQNSITLEQQLRKRINENPREAIPISAQNTSTPLMNDGAGFADPHRSI